MSDGTVRELPDTGRVTSRGPVVVCRDGQGYVVAVFKRSEVVAWGNRHPMSTHTRSLIKSVE